MATFSKALLSGSTDGKGINVADTTTPGTLIHTGSNSSSELHEVWLYATNYSAAGTNLSIMFGGSAAKDAITIYLEPYTGLQLVASGLILMGNSTPNVIRAYTTSANLVSVFGYVNTIV